MFFVPRVRGYAGRIVWLQCRKVVMLTVIFITLAAIPYCVVPLYEPKVTDFFEVALAAHLCMLVWTVYAGLERCNWMTRTLLNRCSDQDFPPWVHVKIMSVAQRAGITRGFTVRNIGFPINVGVSTGMRDPVVLGIAGGAHSVFTEQEFEIVLAHEMAHVRAHDGFIITILATWRFIYWACAVMALLHGSLAALAILGVLWCVHCFCLATYTRTTEYLADLGALHILGKERWSDLVSALRRLDASRPLESRSPIWKYVLRLWSDCYPSLDSRIKILTPKR